VPDLIEGGGEEAKVGHHVIKDLNLADPGQIAHRKRRSGTRSHAVSAQVIDLAPRQLHEVRAAN
jgi:hypothetical protein